MRFAVPPFPSTKMARDILVPVCHGVEEKRRVAVRGVELGPVLDGARGGPEAEPIDRSNVAQRPDVEHVIVHIGFLSNDEHISKENKTREKMNASLLIIGQKRK